MSPIPPKFTKREDRQAVRKSRVQLHCRLQDFIDAQGLTRTMLSKETGLTSAAIRGLCENTARRFDADTLAIICDYFGCGMGDLFQLVPRRQIRKSVDVIQTPTPDESANLEQSRLEQ